MAEKDHDSLIGYDPLAWMRDSQVEQPADAEQAAETLVQEPMIEIEQWQAPSEAEQFAEPEENGVWQAEEENHAEEHDSAAWRGDEAIVLDAVLKIQNVAELHQRLLDALDNQGKIEIDASAVTSIDTATLQLLLILKRTAINLQKEVVIDFPSERFVEAAELLGLSKMLEVDQPAAGLF